jgi:hypothetical protein
MKRLAPLVLSCVLFFALAATAQPPEHKEAAIDKKIFDAYVGRYQMAPNFILNITRDGDDFYAQASGQGAVEIFPESEKEFFAKGPAITISFTTDASGKATQLVLHQGGQNTTAPRIDGEPDKPKHHTAIAVDPAAMAGYVGRYQMPNDRIMTITLEDGHLYSGATGRAKFEIFPETASDFFMKVIELQITFHPDAQGQATELVVHQGPANVPCKRIVAVTAASVQSQLAEIDKMAATDFGRRSIGSLTSRSRLRQRAGLDQELRRRGHGEENARGPGHRLPHRLHHQDVHGRDAGAVGGGRKSTLFRSGGEVLPGA